MTYANFLAQFGGSYLPLAGGTMSGAILDLVAGYNYTAVAAPTNLPTTKSNNLYEFTAATSLTAAAVATYDDGYVFAMKNTSGGSATFVLHGADTLDGVAATLTLANQSGAIISKTAGQWSTLSSFVFGTVSSPWRLGAGTLSALGGGATSSIGNNSLSWGANSKSGGINSISLGTGNNAAGDNSIALQGGQANAQNSVAIIGTASGINSFALGAGAAGGDYSYALGKGAAANFTGSFVWGDSQNNDASDSAADQFIVNCNGGLYVFVNTAVAAALALNVDANGNLINVQGVADQSYSRQVPTTGFSITIGAGVKTLCIVPGSQLATGTIIMPAAPIDGQIIIVAAEAAGVTALTVQGNAGQTIGNAPTSISAGGGFMYQYNLANTNWMPIFQNLAGAGSSPWTAAGTNSAIGGDGSITSTGTNCLAYGSGGGYANGIDSFAMGYNAECDLNYSFAFGYQSFARGNYQFVFGSNNSRAGVSANNAFAFGDNSYVGGAFGVAHGNGAACSNAGSWVIGDSNVSPNADSAANQFNATFANGYRLFNGATLAVWIDPSSNLINKKGTADQSYSLQAPSTGFSITIAAGVRTLVLNPAGLLATGTITMPAAPIDGQEIVVSAENFGVTALTVSANSGQTISNPPTTLAAGQGFKYEYNLANTNWMPIFQNLAGAGSSPWTAGAGTGSAIGGDGSATAVGNYSLAYGSSGTSAAGRNSVAFGDNVHADFDYCFTFGRNNSRSQTTGSTDNICMGDTCIVNKANHSVAIGYNNTVVASGGVSDYGNVAIGFGNSTGVFNVATQGAVAIGWSNSAAGSYSCAMGNGATANNPGFYVWSDSNHSGNQDTAGNQWVATASNGFFHYSGSTLLANFLTIGCALKGTNTNNNATAGYVGEIISSVIASGSAVSLSTGTAANITSISLTAGDWDLWGNYFVVASVATTVVSGWISTTSATVPDSSLISQANNISGTTQVGLTAPGVRLSLASTTTVYISVEANFASGTCVASGGIYARRAR